MKLLLHICCGPCALYPFKKLRGGQFDEITGYYYNPNIHPPSEYKKRRTALKAAAEKAGFNVIYPAYNMEEYFKAVPVSEYKKKRCPLCWEMRIKASVRYARENGYDAFTTTLLISPYQDHGIIRSICDKQAVESGVKFYYEDFRKGFRDSQEQARQGELYRQKYCGCVFSELERVKI